MTVAAPAPIQTRYRGRRFRSRLEARWAIVLDELGVPWEHEPEGYALSSGWYLPDFRLQLASGPAWLEVKSPHLLDLKSDPRWKELGEATGHRVYVAFGIPEPGEFDHYRHCVLQWPFWQDYQFLCVCLCGRVDLAYEGRPARICRRAVCRAVDAPGLSHPRLVRAYERALSARFD